MRAKNTDLNNNPPEKILIINIFGIGDVLFTTPLMENIKLHWPDVSIGYLCNRRTEELLKGYPWINQLIVYERDEFNKVWRQSKTAFIKKILGLIKEIKRARYDAVIDLSLNSFTPFLAWAARVPFRAGLNYKKRSFLLNHKIPLKGYENKHVIEYYLDILRVLGIPVQKKDMTLFITQSDNEWADKFFRLNGLKPKQRCVGLVPGGGASWGKDAEYKRWPAEKYAQLADKLIEKYSAAIILCGDKSETGLCLKVADLMERKPVPAFGQTTITQFAALAKKCSLLIVNDGGPLHVAAAAGAKTLSVFGPVDEKVYGPYPSKGHIVVKSDMICSPCYRRYRRARCGHVKCLHNLTVNDVFQKAGEVL